MNKENGISKSPMGTDFSQVRKKIEDPKSSPTKITASTVNEVYHKAIKEKDSLFMVTTVGKYTVAENKGLIKNTFDSAMYNGLMAGLTPDEFLAIYAYSTKFYKVYNAFKRNQEDILIKEAENYQKAIRTNTELEEVSKLPLKVFIELMKADCELIDKAFMSGLDKLPSHRGKTIRGDVLNEGEYNEMKNGSFTSPTVLSSSKSDTYWQDWVFRKPENDEKYHAYIEIMGMNGKNISKFSSHPDEDEIIYKPGTTFVQTAFIDKVEIFEKVQLPYLSIVLEEKQ